MKMGWIVFIFISFHHVCFATELSYSRSQSASSQSDRLAVKQKIDQHRLGLSASQSKDTTNTLIDDKSNSLRLSYGYRTKSATLTTLEVRQTNEFYEFTGLGGSLKTSFTVLESKYEVDDQTQTASDLEIEPTYDILKTKMSLKLDTIAKTYVKSSSESFRVNVLTIALEQDLTSNFVVGVDYSVYNYQTTSPLLKRVLDEQTVLDSNLSSILSSAVKSSANIFAEYSFSDLAVGLSVGADSPYFTSGTKATTFEFFFDYSVNDYFSFNASYTRSRSENTSSVSNTTSAGLSLRF